VGLSYNGARKHHTVPGAICSIISGLLISFQMYTTFIKYSNSDYTNVTRNNHDLLLDQSKPPSYNITVAQMNMMSLVQTTNQTITNPTAYFSGLYL
jgi:hypothetical protein